MPKGKLEHRQPAGAEDTRSLGPLSDLVSTQLRRVDILLTRGFAITETKKNLRSGAMSCLGLIVGNPGISQNDLARLTGTDKSNIVPLANTLEERGWAKRTQDPQDRRKYALFATPEGIAALDLLAKQIKAVEDSMLADVSAEELALLSILLRRMHNSCVASIHRAQADEEQPKAD